jgi:arginine deiminase
VENQRSLTDEKVLALEGVQEELDSKIKAVRQRDTEVLVLQDMLEETKTKLERKSDDYDDLVKNTARSICCKNKIDNPNINFFDVDDDRIVCSETDGEQLSCW